MTNLKSDENIKHFLFRNYSLCTRNPRGKFMDTHEISFCSDKIAITYIIYDITQKIKDLTRKATNLAFCCVDVVKIVTIKTLE